jgi:hypothetical protein
MRWILQIAEAFGSYKGRKKTFKIEVSIEPIIKMKIMKMISGEVMSALVRFVIEFVSV